jgi:hypothetical protein
MKIRWMLLPGILLALTKGSLAFAEPFTVEQVEINYLLNFVEVSGCEFYRNGSWYDSVEAQQHLRSKLDYLSARKRISTAEDFIRLAASKSSMSGRAYEVRCGGCSSIPTADWLSAVLARYRIAATRESGAP